MVGSFCLTVSVWSAPAEKPGTSFHTLFLLYNNCQVTTYPCFQAPTKAERTTTTRASKVTTSKATITMVLLKVPHLASTVLPLALLQANGDLHLDHLHGTTNREEAISTPRISISSSSSISRLNRECTSRWATSPDSMEVNRLRETTVPFPALLLWPHKVSGTIRT